MSLVSFISAPGFCTPEVQTCSMQQPTRQRLRPWLEEQIQSGKYPGVSWLDQVTPSHPQQPPQHPHRHVHTHLGSSCFLKSVKLNSMWHNIYLVRQSARIFQIPWKHAARHGWSIDRDATLFRSWAMHTGKVHTHDQVYFISSQICLGFLFMQMSCKYASSSTGELSITFNDWSCQIM